MVRIITDYLDQTAQLYPDKAAFASQKENITFRDLRDTAQKLGSALIHKNIFQKPVAILLEKSPRTIIAMLGVAYSGNFYTILDDKMPLSRMKKIIDVLEPVFIITDLKLKKLAEQLCPEKNVILLEEV